MFFLSFHACCFFVLGCMVFACYKQVKAYAASRCVHHPCMRVSAFILGWMRHWVLMSASSFSFPRSALCESGAAAELKRNNKLLRVWLCWLHKCWHGTAFRASFRFDRPPSGVFEVSSTCIMFRRNETRMLQTRICIGHKRTARHSATSADSTRSFMP